MRRLGLARRATLAALLVGAAALPLSVLACVDWERLASPLPDAGGDLEPDGGPEGDAGPLACDGPPPDAPELPAARCGSIEPLEGEDWQLHPFLATGTNEPMIGARVDQLVIADGPDLHFFCGDDEDAASPVHCTASPLGAMDVAANGTLVVGTMGGACVVNDAGCQCVLIDEPDAELAAVAVVGADRFVMLVQFGDAEGAPSPVLQERPLANPTDVLGALSLPDVPHTRDLPTLTRLARPCADPSTWAVAAHFATSNALFTMERRFTPGGLTVDELEPFEQGEAVAVVAPPVGSAPMTPAQLISSRVSTSLELELRRGGLQSGLVDKGLYLQGGSAGYGDFVSGPCATSEEGRVACTGSPGLLVTTSGTDPLHALALPGSVQRYGDSTGAASLGDDAWIFGNDFLAHTSLSLPTQATAIPTGVTANLGAGERVVGAPLGEGRILLGSFTRTVSVHVADGVPPVITEVPVAIDALAMGAGGFPGSGVVAWLDRDPLMMRVSAAAVSDDGAFFGQIPAGFDVESTALEPLVAAADPSAPAGTASLWFGGLEDFDNPAQARLNLQNCKAVAPGGVPQIGCTTIYTTAFDVRWDLDHPGALSVDGDWIIYAGNGAVAALELNPSRDWIVRDGATLVPIVNNVDPFARGVSAIAHAVDCIYVAAPGRLVQALQLSVGQDLTLTPRTLLSQQLDARALLTAGDDSILVGAEHGRLGRWPNLPHDDLCFSDAPDAPFAVSDGPARPTGELRWRPVFAGDRLYVADEDRRVWRVPLP